MSLSANIKKFRTEKNMTQEQLASVLGVSAQAVSKWETSETYPDGSLLVPLAGALSVSLDTLFDNIAVSMADISERIITLLRQTKSEEHFNIVRDICWQIERGLFNSQMEIDKKYAPEEIKNVHNASFILRDTGFTHISNGSEPFFAVFPEPEKGFGDFLNDKDFLQKIFTALSREDTMNALIHLYRKNGNYVFEIAVLANDCNIASDKIDTVISDLRLLKVIWQNKLTVNGKEHTLYYSRPNHQLLAVFLMAKELGYKGTYTLQCHNRSTPFLKAST